MAGLLAHLLPREGLATTLMQRHLNEVPHGLLLGALGVWVENSVGRLEGHLVGVR